ncbi:MAG: DUF5979 domain-containing protein [Acidimicrobiia bacterium]
MERARVGRGGAAGRVVRLLAAVCSVLVGAAGLGLVGAGPAAADLGDPGQVTLDKAADGLADLTGVAPGETFAYTFLVGCDDNPCIDAALTDTLPPEFAGFAIESLSVTPATTPATATATLTGCAVGGPVTPSCDLSVAFSAPLGDLGGVPQVGIPAGVTYRVTLQLTVPLDQDPTWPSNGVAVPNTAEATASNSTPATDTATVTVEVPVVVEVTTSKAWSVDSQQFEPGAAASFTIGAASVANVPATSLVLEDPLGALDGATGLPAGNPFRYVDLTGLCAPSVLPEGADLVQVDLYVLDEIAGTWSWSAGTPGATATLPDVGGAQVAGLRVTYSGSGGATIVPGGTAASQCVSTVQRATDRETDASLVGGVTVPNTVGSELVVPGQDPASGTASDSFVVAPLDVEVTPGKTISPSEVPASGTFGVQLAARNDSNGPLTSLTIREPADLEDGPFLSEDLAFDGFTGWTWPTGATAGELVWAFADGTTSAPVALTPSGGPPTAPATPPAVAGFTVTYTGEIVPGTTAGIGFDVTTDPETVPAGTVSLPFVNVVEVSGTNPAGTDTETAQDDVTVYFPEIELTLDKEVRPALVTPGGTVVTELRAQTATNAPTVDPTTIVVEDVWDGTAATGFWDAFRARSISFTQVPADSTMTVEYATGTPPTLVWTTLATGVTGLYSADLPAGIADDVVGLRFTFENPEGFAQGTIVQPNVVFEASGELRDGTPTTEEEGVPVAYDNAALAQGSGDAGGVPVTSDEVPAEGTVEIVDFGDGPGTLLADKRWVQADWATDLPAVLSQSGSAAFTRHAWGVTVPGYTSVVLSDPLPGTEGTPGATTFQAFDLTAIRPITYAQDPLLRWDRVSSVELHLAGTWTTITAPGGSWMDGTGFKGYVLTGPQAAAATGVRVTVVEDAAARAASTQPGRPAVGSGVAWSATGRPFGLQWQLRNTLRVPGAGPDDRWATGEVTYNGGEGDVVNHFRVAGTTATDTFARDESDDVVLQDVPPGVDTAKAVAPGSVVVPYPGDVPAVGYPTVDVTVDAWNTAWARASYLRVADPVPCPTATACVTPGDDHDPDVFTGNAYDPATNPFERFALSGVDFVVPGTVPVDPAATQVALWRYDEADGTTSVEVTTMAALDGLGATALADVVGVAIVYQSTDPATTGGLIPQGSSDGTNVVRMVLRTQLRPTLRSTGADVVGGVEVDNEIVAQSFDPVLDPDATPNASDEATVRLDTAGLDVTASKSITPTTILETDPDVPVTVTLGATDGTSTLAAETATITDTDPEFWAAFALTGLGAVTRPAGADLVRVDVQVDGDPTWVEGVADPVASLPAEVTDLATVTGIRFVFLNEPSRPFSATAPSADWTAQAVLGVVLRDGVEFPGQVDDTVEVEATHTGYPPATDEATAGVELSTGTPRIDVQKEPITGGPKIVEPGVSTPWTLRFTNVGTSYFQVERVVDDLGPWLRYDGSAPIYESDGELPTEGITIAQAAADDLTFTFPAGSRMAPGDSFTITVGIVLVPGLTSDQRATNGFLVDTDATFVPGDCTNTSGNGQGILTGLPDDSCGTSNYVQPQSGPLLFAEKEVRGEVDGDLVDGASNVFNPALPCTPEPGAFFRTVCVAYTAIGATDEWRIGSTNTGTVPYTTMTFVDVLPRPGDRLLSTGAPRQSQWRPVLDVDFGVVATIPLPAGATYTVEVTTSTEACLGAGGPSAWPSDPACATHPGPAEWELLDDFAGDPAEIAALRIFVDFAGTVAGELPPGQNVQFVYHTANRPWDEGEPTAEAVRPELWTAGQTQRSWNQVGVSATLTSGGTIARAPERTGVQMLTGALEVAKTLSGDAAAHAPTEIPFDLSCTVPDGLGGTVPVDLGEAATLVVPTGGTARLDGLPLGATCTVTEDGELGDHGEAARTPATPLTVEVTEPGGPEDPVPDGQSVTFDNRYDFGGLRVLKEIAEQTSPAVPFGPWDFTITCTTPFPTPTVVLDEAFTLDLEPDEYAVPADTVPVNATCVVREDRPSDETTIVGEGATDGGDGTAEIVIGPDSEVLVTNRYAVGTLEVAKQRTGDGVERYGAGPFVVDAVCTYGEVGTVYTGSATLDAEGGYVARFRDGDGDAWLPAGADCTLSESATAGATGTSVFSPSATVSIVGGEPGGVAADEPTAVTLTNAFDTGRIVVAKEVVGSGAELYGAGPFVVRLECSYDRDGVPTPITWDGEAHLDLVLDAAGDYRRVVDDLLVGARCQGTETVTGGATEVAVGDPVVVPAAGAPAAVLTVTNTFAGGELVVAKERTGAGAAARGAGPFTVTVACTWVVDGVPVAIEVPGGADVVLSEANGYRARIHPLPVGAACTVTEVDPAGADSVAYEPADGTVTIPAAPAVATVTVVNHYDPPQVGGAGGGRLPRTGADGRLLARLVVDGSALVVVGLAAVVLARRRRRAT